MVNEYHIQLSMRLDAGALQALIRTLDSGPHGLMRGIIDTIISQARQQDDAANSAAAPGQEIPPEDRVVGGTD